VSWIGGSAGSCFPDAVVTTGVTVNVVVPLGVKICGVDCAFAGLMLAPPQPAQFTNTTSTTAVEQMRNNTPVVILSCRMPKCSNANSTIPSRLRIVGQRETSGGLGSDQRQGETINPAPVVLTETL
jgi:hypothetical protein